MTYNTNFCRIRDKLPDNVTILAAAKTRSKEEILNLIEVGATDIGYNYVQEAVEMHKQLGSSAKKLRWHLIGHLQKNKINKALSVFDAIQTIDSLELAKALDKKTQKKLAVFIELNIGYERNKSGVLPDFHAIESLVKGISNLKNLKLEGIMTIGPRFDSSESYRPYFRKARYIFDSINHLNIPNIALKSLSMGMSDSYKVAIEEGSNMIRLGTIIFGDR